MDHTTEIDTLSESSLYESSSISAALKNGATPPYQHLKLVKRLSAPEAGEEGMQRYNGDPSLWSLFQILAGMDLLGDADVRLGHNLCHGGG